MKKLVLFIHGLGGSADGTWKKFPEMIREDAELAEQYDVGTIDYISGAFGPKPGFPTCAAILKTWIDTHHSARPDIALIAHSQGGLVARHYIAERINSGERLPVSRLLTFATPHQGSGFASLLKRVPLTSQQTKDLDPNSEFMRELAVAWGQAKADWRVLTKYVVAAGDAIVGPVSAMGTWSPGYEVVSGVGHLAVVKPEAADDTSFLIAKKFLLEDSLLPGGVAADYQAPLLRFNHVDPREINRFLYGARVLPLFGRDSEIDILAGFLGGPEQPFRWMVMHGSGGVGKSRLALELCLAARDEWHTGFLPQDGQEPDWGRWQPLMPTLIVIDYAARDPEHTGKVLRALAGRGPADGTLRLAAPVRVLLVERTGEGDWLNKTVGVGTTKAQVNAAHASANLPLATISDPWPIFEFVLNKAEKPLPDKTETLTALGEIDHERRPLFAYFMADAIADGRDIRHFDAARLLDQVIERGREKFWVPAGATAKEERLLAVATMAGGLPVSTLKGMKEELLPSWSVDLHPKAFLAMTGRESGENILPLEPDIVGEHFALACLAQKNLANEDRARLCGLAWRLDPFGMAQFMLRAHRDLPAHLMLYWVRKSPPSAGLPQLLWAMASADLMNDLRLRDPVAVRALLDKMRDVAAARDEASLWELWAMASHNLMEDLRSRDPVAARALLDDMRGAAAARDEALLWVLWAKAAVNLMIDLQSRDPVAARALLDDMRGAAAARDEALLWEWWAKAAVNLMIDLRSHDPVAARGLLDAMRGVAAARDEALLWEWWANAAVNLMIDLPSRDPDAARGLLDAMRGVAAARGDAPLWEEWAGAAFNVMIDLQSRDPDAARVLLDDMRSVAEARDEAALWEWWAKAAVTLTIGLRSRDPVAARALIAEVLALPPEILQRIEWGG